MGGCYPLRPAPVRGGAAGVLEGVAATSSPRPAVLFSSRMMEETYFRKGFGLKAEVKGVVEAEYNSALVERIRARGYQETFGDVTVRLAQEFGFCYGVDRAVDYAYETVHKFPDRRIYLVGEIIHNPHVNKRMTEMGIRFI
jgi:4-hydroxy-3-methylbut-2-enyl diphosphate reductase